MYFGARKKRFQLNFWYSVSSGGPAGVLVFFFFDSEGSIMPDISMSLSFLRNHIAGAASGGHPVWREFLASQGGQREGCVRNPVQAWGAHGGEVGSTDVVEEEEIRQ